MPSRSLALATALLVVSSLVVPTRLPAGEEAPEGDEAVVELLTTRPLPLEGFLQVVGKVAGVPLVWDPGAVEVSRAKLVATVNLIAERRQLFELVRTVLATYDLALVPIGPRGSEVYRVTRIADLAGSATAQPTLIELRDDDLDRYRTAHGLYVSTTLRVEHLADLAAARSALMAHATAGGVGHVEALPDLPGFAVTDFAPAVVLMHDALRRIDVPPTPGPAHVTKRIDLEHARADVTALALAGHLGANLPHDAGPSRGLRILGDERTNSLLVSGAPERVAEVEQAVALLDVPVERPSTWIHVVPLEHRDAAATAAALRALAASGGVLDGGDDAPPTTIVADEEGNALLVQATPRVFEELKRLLEQLDQAQPADDAR